MRKRVATLPYIESVLLRRDDVPSFKKYPFSLPAVRPLTELRLHPHVTFFVGENGTGKSTLLEAIAVAAGLNAEGGSRNFQFATRASHSALGDFLTLKRGVSRPEDGFFLRAESFYNVATEVDNMGDFRYYGGRSLHEQSHGESFFALFMNRFFGNGLYLLDEPEAALSPMRQMAMLTRIHQLVKQHSQFLIATHSPILMAYPDAQILQFTEDGVRAVRLEETEHFLVTRQFLERPDKMLRILLGDEEASQP